MFTIPQDHDMVHKNQANHKKAFQSKANRPLSKICMGEGEQGPPWQVSVPSVHVVMGRVYQVNKFEQVHVVVGFLCDL